MGRCSVCRNKILYNAFEKIKGIIYCPKCVPKEAAIAINTAKLEFAEFQDAMKEVAIITVNEAEAAINKKLAEELGEPIKITIEPKVCKYCGAKNSKEWLQTWNETWCCKRRGCRSKMVKECEEFKKED